MNRKKGPPTVQSAYATIIEAGLYLNLGRTAVYSLMDNNELAHAKFGRLRRIPWDALREYAERNTTAVKAS